ncbi:MAG: hypothetical protein Tsb0010_08080 [Parvularculaceae bacterium]
MPRPILMLTALAAVFSAAAPARGEPPADAREALRQAVYHYCLPAVMAGHSVAEYAFGGGLEPIEKSLLALNDGGKARYAWLFKYDGGQLVVSEEGRAPANTCQIFMRRGDAAAAQRSIAELLACDACYFEKDRRATVETGAMRRDAYVWRDGGRVVRIEAARRLRRENRSDPVFFLTVNASSVGASGD